MAWSQEISQLKIAVGTWWNLKMWRMQYTVAWDSGLTQKDSERDNGHRTQMQEVDAEMQRHRKKHKELTGLLKWLENLRRTKKSHRLMMWQ